MRKGTATGLVPGLAVGAVVGSAVGMMSGPHNSSRRKKIKKTATKAIHRIGDVLENVGSVVR